MNSSSKIFLLLTLCYMIFGQQGPCEIPSNGSQGQCKSIFKCQPLLSLVNQAQKTLQEKDLLYKSSCGIDDDAPAVCCPQQNKTRPCTTPEGKLGECISLYSCPQFLTLLNQPLTDDIIKFMQTSQCDGTAQYNVCCGPVPSLVNCKLTSFPPDPRTGCCGLDSSFDNKIIGGNATSIEQYPWLAMLEFDKNGTKRIYGSGSLISGQYVLTAGLASIANSFGQVVNIILGEYDTSNEGPDCVEVEGGGTDCTDGAIKIPVDKVIIHPEYNSTSRINNIALIKMKRNVLYSDFIRPICLPTADVTLLSEPFHLTAAGWGATSSSQSSSNIKLQVDLPHVSRKQCQRVYSIDYKTVEIRDTHLCAGGELRKDTCRGDTTLMYKRGPRYEYAGIVSFGTIPCGYNVPTVYTNVYKYNTWIKENIVP